MSLKERFVNKNLAANLVSQFRFLYEHKNDSDFTIIAQCDGSRIKAHRAVLSLSSGYFFNLFSRRRYSKAKIELPNFKGETLQKVVEFMYIGSIDLNIENVRRVLAAASYLENIELEKACCDLIKNPKNYLEIASNERSETLRHEALNIAYQNLDILCTSEKFHRLHKDELCEFLCGYKQANPNHGVMFYSLLQWYHYDKSNRRDLMSYLVHSFIQFDLLEDMPLVLEWNLESSKHIELKKLFVLTHSLDMMRVQSYNQFTNEWTLEPCPVPPIRVSDYSLLLYKKQIFMCGGVTLEDGKTSDRVTYLDLESMKWHELPRMNQARSHDAIFIRQGHLYVVGDSYIDMVPLSIERYDFSKKKWEYIGPSRTSFALYEMSRAAILNNSLYVPEPSGYLHIFDFTTNKWVKSSHSLLSCGFNDITVLNGCLYLAGGMAKTDKKTVIVEFNPKSNRWTHLLDFKNSKIIRCTAFNNRIVVLTEECCKAYDPKTKILEDISRDSLYLNWDDHGHILCTDEVDYHTY